MKHPQREEWIPYLFGETDPETKKQLAEHLRGCPGCAEELEGWRRSVGRLDAWTLPRSQRRRLPILSPALNLAAAAVVILGLGLGLGRWVILPAMRQEIRHEVAGEWQARFDQLQHDSNDALQRVKAESVNASAADAAEALQQLITDIRSARADDQEALERGLDELRTHHETDFVSLRKDLETVATTTDDRIRAAQLKLIELTAFTPTANK